MLIELSRMITLEYLVLIAATLLPVHYANYNSFNDIPQNSTRMRFPPNLNNKLERDKVYPSIKFRPPMSFLPMTPLIYTDYLKPVEEPIIVHSKYIIDTPYSNYKGNDYPDYEISAFLDDNKAMMRRMYGSINPMYYYNPTPNSQARYRKQRYSRQVSEEQELGSNFCPSQKETVSPYWAFNASNYKFAIVNQEPFTQAVHIEKCLQAKSCGQSNCRCAQEYTWIRLLALDPNGGCQGIFMEWFKFPSCCLCKCF